MVKCLIISHLGLGDNITMIGMCRYLSEYYDEVYITCQKKYYDNVRLFFQNEPKIKVFITHGDELKTLPDKLLNFDIYNSGFCYNIDKNFTVRSTIKLREYENHTEVNNILNLFYNRVNIPFRIYSEYFEIPKTQKSLELYNYVKKYNIIFVHEICSNHNFDIFKQLENISDDDIIICANRNYYKNGEKFNLAQKFINAPILDYIDTIYNSKKIMVADSCFSCIVIPSKLKGSIKTDDITFFIRCNEHIKLFQEILPISKISR